MAVACLTLVLGALIFAAGYEMFSAGAGLIALVLFVFEPSILAHGALVTTDAGFSLFLLATIYAFYRYVKQPSRVRLALTAIAAGLGLATKHSGVLIFPILLLLVLTEIVRRESATAAAGTRRPEFIRKHVLGLVAIGIISIVILWGFYGFRFSTRPVGERMVPSLPGAVDRLENPRDAKILLAIARSKLLPEAYLYGLADVKEVAENSPSYLFGKVYPHGVWYYFPVAFVIKSTITLLVLLVLIPVALRAKSGTWGTWGREILFLVIPPGVYVAVAMGSKLNLGIRHLLPIYPFLFLLAGMGGWLLMRQRRAWVYVVALLLAFDVFSSIRAFPNYIPYSNELWGGAQDTSDFLTDSNVDWGQQLKTVKKYLDQRKAKNCWFAYFADVVADPSYYGVPCKPLTTIASVWLQPQMEVSPEIDGPVLISAGVLSGYEFGPGELNPYGEFQKLRPTAVIDDGIFVYDGHFAVPLASALNHITRAQQLEDQGHAQEALAEVQTAVTLAPRSARVRSELARRLLAANRKEEARAAFQTALTLAQSVEPNYQAGLIHSLQHSLAEMAH
jgi:tetratricopeptide (TPR) repeat protein